MLARFFTAVCFLLVSHLSVAAKLNIGIVVFDGFLTSDVTAPVEVFGAASKQAWFSDYQVVLISATREKTITAEEGLKVIADHTIYEDLTLDALIVPSSYDMERWVGNKDLVAFVQQHGQQASWLASNCSGAFLLAQAGLLNGKKATTWAGGEKDLAKLFPKVDVQVDQNVVIDGNLVTSNGGPVSYQGAFALLEMMSSKKFADEISATIQFNRISK